MSSQPKKKVPDSKDLLMSSLSKFYNTKSNITKILPILEGTSPVSLRLIDWFVTNYSKKYNNVITKEVHNNVIHFNVYLSYRSQLKAYSKQLFDPFRRRERIAFTYDQSSRKSIETTIGQLNFFRWVIQNDILDYMEKHLVDIEDDMLKTHKENVKNANADNSVKKKRNQLSKATIANVNMVSGRRVVQFD